MSLILANVARREAPPRFALPRTMTDRQDKTKWHKVRHGECFLTEAEFCLGFYSHHGNSCSWVINKKKDSLYIFMVGILIRWLWRCHQVCSDWTKHHLQMKIPQTETPAINFQFASWSTVAWSSSCFLDTLMPGQQQFVFKTSTQMNQIWKEFFSGHFSWGAHTSETVQLLSMNSNSSGTSAGKPPAKYQEKTKVKCRCFALQGVNFFHLSGTSNKGNNYNIHKTWSDELWQFL